MLLTEFQPTSDASTAGLAGRLALRVHGPAEDYLVDLLHGTTTIGSSPRCNIRIQRPGVHPLHCLVICERGGLTARRWAADALLNGQPFDDAPLAAGDHLSLGPVDLEVVAESADEQVDSCHNAGRYAESIDGSTSEPAGVSWGKDTIHHTTVWVGEDEEEVGQAPSEHVEAQFPDPAEPALEAVAEIATPMKVEAPAEVVPADAAREVFRQLQAANANSRLRSRKLLKALRTSRHANQTLSDQVIGLTNTKDELVAELTALARERNLLREQLATAEVRYAEWDHQSNQWEELRKEWDAARVEWNHERTDWTRQVGDWEARLAGHVGRIEKLEAQLAEAHADEHERTQAQPETFHTEVPAVLPTSAEAAQESRPRLESQPEALVSAPASDEQLPELLTAAEPVTSDAQIPAWEPTAPAEPPAWDRHTPAWESEPPSWEDHGPQPGEQAPTWDDRNRRPDREFPVEPQKPETDAAPAVEQAVAPTVPSASVTVAAPIAPREAAESESPTEGNQLRTVSYIERFAPMFADEQTSEQAPASPDAAPAAVDPVVDKPRNGPTVRADGNAPATIVGEVEESIEEYMAKLMQRVRGDRPYVAGSQAPPAAHSPRPDATADPPQVASPHPTTLPTPAAVQEAGGTANETRKNLDERVPDLSELIRKGPVISQPTNMKALRALANETARRAIGVHASKKHRREAMTKFVVASLAGISSVWLMMLAPDWRDLQFVSACLSLLIAAYWAGQVYGKLVEMHRAGDYDGPETKDDFDDVTAAPSPTRHEG